MKTPMGISDDDGFSLLEMLFALAIMSMASLALFQSTSAMLQLSGRAVAAGERTLNTGLDRQVLNNLAEGLLPAWPEEPQREFMGSADRFYGQSTGAPELGAARPAAFSLSLAPQSGGGMMMLYQSLENGKSKGGAESWVLLAGLPEGSRWEYMGIDHKFYSIWPPKTRPERGYFNDDLLLTMPPLPEAIKLVSREGITLWTGAVGRAKALPGRAEIGLTP